MKAIHLENQSFLVQDNLPIPVPNAGEALIKLHLAGICGTDLALARGYANFTGIPGHEFVGEVAQAPDAPEWIGQRVVGDINIACGECAECQRGYRKHCENRQVLGIRDRPGAFAEYFTLPIRNLYRLPESISDARAVFVEPVAAALQILEQVPLDAADQVIVVGAGKLGQLIARVLATTTCGLRVVARYPEQFAALARAGIEAISESEAAGARADVVIEASGSAQGLAFAARLVRPRGRIVLKSTYPGKLEFDFSGLVVNEISIVGSRCGPFDKAIELLASGAINVGDPAPLEYPLRDFDTALRCALEKGAGKVLLRP